MTFPYPPGQKIDRRSGLILAFVDDDGEREAAGYHTPWFGVIDMSQSSMPWATAGHEALEMYGNHMLTRFAPSLEDLRLTLAVELNDPTQGRHYPVSVQLPWFGDTLLMPDFVLPAWFTGAPGPTTYCELMGTHLRLQPNEIAPDGYQIALEEDGGAIFLGAEAERRVQEKIAARPGSRTAQMRALFSTAKP